MAKVDIKSTYRNVSVHPDDRWMMGMLWEGALFVDTALLFGIRSAATVVQWRLQDSIIKSLGRWETGAYILCIRTLQEALVFSGRYTS